eukprot:TRINITY_DN10499_c0_g1_i2.p1 TRINITY_DN10499_c0_g1~~TRINITY_DN10499_c0_g1_i2.p1  ORF type:complete len:179 (+),score=29.51 TRINITY_DN10499_c0_g1_i2:125-661(+)
MSAVPSSISSPASVAHCIRSNSNRNGVFFNTFFNSRISSKPPLNHLFFRNSSGAKRKSTFTASRPFSPVMEWQDCMAKIEVDVPSSAAYNCYSDREAIPRWMPFISSVKVLEDKPDLSRWSLKYEAFGRDLEFSWLARNMQCSLSQIRKSIGDPWKVYLTSKFVLVRRASSDHFGTIL